MDYLLRDLKLDHLVMQKLSVTQVAQRMCQATGGSRSSCYIPSVFLTISTQKDKTAAVFTTCLILSLSLFFKYCTHWQLIKLSICCLGFLNCCTAESLLIVFSPTFPFKTIPSCDSDCLINTGAGLCYRKRVLI